MIYTTLNKIRVCEPCSDGWEKLLKNLGKTKPDDEPLSMLTILKSNGFDDAVWCLKAFEGIDKEARLFGVACARRVQHLMTDKSINALDVAERYAHGQATADELRAARDAAKDAWADTQEVAAWDAEGAAWAAAQTAWDAAGTARAAGAAARTAKDAAWAARAAGAAARTAWDAARAAGAAAWAAEHAERAWQEQEFKRVFCGGEK